MVAAISLNPTHAKVGDTVTITGSGFTPLATPVSFTFGGASIVPTDAPISVSAGGAFTAHIVVPASVKGNHTINADDGTLNANATFATDQNATIDPTSGPAGELLTIAGSGFAGTSAITLTLDGKTVSPVSGITSNSSGTISGSLQLAPDIAQGAHTLVITDASSNSITLTYTVSEGLVIAVTKQNPNKFYSLLATGVIDEEGIPVANDSYVAIGLIDMTNYIRATLELYNPDSAHDLTYSILGLIDDSSGVTPDAASTKWLAITSYTDVDITHGTGKLAEITTRYSWLMVKVKRKTSGQDASVNITGRLHAF